MGRLCGERGSESQECCGADYAANEVAGKERTKRGPWGVG